jgi:hypothetical protein
MDIDSFFTNGDLSFGMDGASPKFKNFAGTGQNVSRGPKYGEFEFNRYPEDGFADDIYANATGTSRLEQPTEWYLSKLTEADKKNCNKLQGVMDSISKDIENNNKKIASAKKGEKRVLADYNKGLEVAGQRVLEFMNAANCAIIKQDEFNKALGAAGAASKSSKVILYVGIGVAALALGIVLYKKFKK